DVRARTHERGGVHVVDDRGQRGAVVVAVVDDDPVAPRGLVVALQHPTGSRRPHRRTARGADVDAVVERAVAVDGVDPPAERGGHGAGSRVVQVTVGVHRPAVAEDAAGGGTSAAGGRGGAAPGLL